MRDSTAYIAVATSDIEALKGYIRGEMHVRSFKENAAISPDINWRPTLQITVNKYTTIAFEISEKVFPPIISLSRTEIVNTNQPICVYSVCSEEECRKNMKDIKILKSHGFGLLMIDDDGNISQYANAIPLAQFIPKNKYDDLVREIPANIKQRIKTAFDTYNQNPVSGLEEITKIVEGIAFNTASKLVTRGDMSLFSSGTSLSDVLADMANVSSPKRSPLRGQLAAIGGFQSYVKEFRNSSHHEPKNKKQAKKQLSHCEAGFTEGIRKISDFVLAFKKYGIRITL